MLERYEQAMRGLDKLFKTEEADLHLIKLAEARLAKNNSARQKKKKKLEEETPFVLLPQVNQI
jgi:hypothetical protein